MIPITKNIRLSHVFCADDVFLFSLASPTNMDNIMHTLHTFGEMSGLKVSMSKSTIIFPVKMCHVIRREVAGSFGFKVSHSFGKYLGVDIRPHKLKIENYFGLLNKTIDRVRGWKSKMLNMASRTTLVKSVLKSYPLYAMQTSIIPKSIVHSLDKACRRFLWNKVDRTHYAPRTSWNVITNPMEMGGLGIRRLRDWNIAFMGNLDWTILTNPNKLWVKVLTEKYLRTSNFLTCLLIKINLLYGGIF